MSRADMSKDELVADLRQLLITANIIRADTPGITLFLDDEISINDTECRNDDDDKLVTYLTPKVTSWLLTSLKIKNDAFEAANQASTHAQLSVLTLEEEKWNLIVERDYMSRERD